MPRARSVLKKAEKIAYEDGFEFIGTEHLILGILSLKECIAFTVLKNLGIDSSDFHRQYESLHKSTNTDVTDKKNLAEVINNVIKNACEQAVKWDHAYIGTEHLLIGILNAGSGLGFKILTDSGITKEKVCDEATKLIVCKNEIN